MKSVQDELNHIADYLSKQMMYQVLSTTALPTTDRDIEKNYPKYEMRIDQE